MQVQHFNRNIQILFCFFLFLHSTFSQSENLKQLVNQWSTVSINENMTPQLKMLTPLEQEEQWRDWVVLAFLRQIVPSDGGTTAFENIYDFPPFRNEALSSLGTWQYGEKRQLNFKNGELYVFVPENSSRQDVYIARAADDYRLQKGQKPQRIYVIAYKLGNNAAQFMVTTEVAGSLVFSKEFGYLEQSASNRNDLISILSQTDDLVFAQKNANGSVLLGGRRFDNFRTAGVSLEDVAAIYKADNKLEHEEQEKNDKLMRQGYNAMIELNATDLVNAFKLSNIYQSNLTQIEYNRKDHEWGYRYKQYNGSGYKALEYLLNNKGMDLTKLTEKERLLIAQLYSDNKEGSSNASNQITTKYLIPKLIEAYPYKWYEEDNKQYYSSDIDFNIGFSLDPYLRKKKFASDLRRIAGGDTSFMRKWFYNAMYPKLIEDYLQKAKINKNSIIAMKSIFERYKKQRSETPAIFIKDTTPAQIYEKSLSSFINGELSLISNKSENDVQEPVKDSLIEDDKLNELLQNLGSDKQDVEYRALLEYEDIKVAIQDNKEVLMYIAQTVDTGNETPYFYLRNYFRGELDLEQLKGKIDNKIYSKLQDGDIENQAKLASFLRYLYLSNQYQKGRYDGDFQGTKVGMTLFYTDLVMKLWSFNYTGSAPEKDIAGFISMVNHPISLNYLDDLKENSSTRSWLKVLDNGYDISEDGQKMFFSHCATKIFNASSNDLKKSEYKSIVKTQIDENGRRPGEGDANYASERFANWWNNHYSEVADYEGEYHRLNQIMKWSQICHWLKLDHRFKFLDDEKVNHSMDFEQWYPNNKQLKAQVNIPFIDKNSLGESTECLAILESLPYLAFQNAESLIYHLSGGVSLGSKSEVVGRIATNSRVRTTIDGNVKNYLRTSFNLKNSKLLSGGGDIKFTKFNRTNVNISPKSRLSSFNSSSTKLRGATSELRNNTNIVRRFEQNSMNDIIINEQTNTAKADIIKINKTATNEVKIELEPSDLSRAQGFVNELSKGDFYENLATVKDAEQILIIQDGYIGEQWLVKLKGNDTWFFIEGSNKSLNTSSLRFATKGEVYSGKPTYRNLSLKSPSEAQSTINSYRYRKINSVEGENKIVELKNILPDEATKIQISSKNVKGDVFVDADKDIYISNNKPTSDALFNFVKQNHKNITTVAEDNGSNQICLFKDADGNTYSVGNRIPTNDEMAILGDLTHNPSSPFKSVVIGEGKIPIKLVSEDIIQVSNNLSKADLDYINLMSEKLEHNKAWTNFFKNTEGGLFSNEDITIMRDIHPDNVEFGNSFLKMKGNSLLNDELVVETRFTSVQGQILMNDNKGIRLFNMKGNSQSEVLNTIRNNTTAKKVITLEPEGGDGLSLAKLSKIEKTGTALDDIQFIKDQPDMARSLDNAREDIYPELNFTVFLSSVKLDDPAFPQIKSEYDNVNSLMFKTILTACTKSEFHHVLDSVEIKQIILTVRATDNGLVFSDGLLTYNELEEWLNKMDEKEMFYIISNKADKIQVLISNSGKSKLTVASHFIIGKPESLAECLKNVSDFYERSRFTAKIKVGKWENMVKDVPALKDIVQKHLSTDNIPQIGKQLDIPTGRFTTDDINQLPLKLWQKLVKATQPIGNAKMPAETKTIKSMINDMQRQKIDEMRMFNKPLNNVNLKAIPDLKVDISKRQVSGWC